MNKMEKALHEKILSQLEAVDEWLTVSEIVRRCTKKGSRGTFKLRVRIAVESMFQKNKIQCEERTIKFGAKKMRVLFYRAKPWQTETAKAKGATTPFLISLDELDEIRYALTNFRST